MQASRNNSGKSATICVLTFAYGTRNQSYLGLMTFDHMT
jgi:hypothetical protein